MQMVVLGNQIGGVDPEPTCGRNAVRVGSTTDSATDQQRKPRGECMPGRMRRGPLVARAFRGFLAKLAAPRFVRKWHKADRHLAINADRLSIRPLCTFLASS